MSHKGNLRLRQNRLSLNRHKGQFFAGDRDAFGGGPHSSDQERALLRWSLLGLFSS